MELNIIQKIWQKGDYSLFRILASRCQKNQKEPYEGNKFCILDGTKHDPKNFDILYFITPK